MKEKKIRLAGLLGIFALCTLSIQTSASTLKEKTLSSEKINIQAAEVAKKVEESNSPQDDIKVTGTVSDGYETLVGVSVVIRGSGQGVITDINGEFSISVPSDTCVLQFSMIGFQKEEVKVGNRKIFAITLKEAVTNMDEIVITAFGGQQRKGSEIGSITTVKPSELKTPSSNLTTALAGRVAGIISYQRSGEPGKDNADFFIRGVTSFGTGKVDPLILIDGVELSVTELARLQSDDIESFSVLKDATSTAVYGARGANGVILITTKRGLEGAPQVSFRAETSISAPTKNIEFANPVRYMQLYNEAVVARDPMKEPFFSQEKIDGTAANLNPIIYPTVDWRKELFKESTNLHKGTLNVRGGGKVVNYFVAGSYSKNNGLLKVDNRNNFNNNIVLNSYTLRANVGINLSKHTELIVRLNGNFDDYNGPATDAADLYQQIVRASPVDFPAYYPKTPENEYVNHIMFGATSNTERSYLPNPYANMIKGYKEYNRSIMLAQLELKQNLSFLTEGLSAKVMMNTNRTAYSQISREYIPFLYEMYYYNPKNLEYNIEPLNESTGSEALTDPPHTYQSQSSIIYLEGMANYDRTIDEKHSLSGLLVFIMRNNLNVRTGAGLDPRYATLQMSLPYRNLGLSGRATYGYANRYFAEFNFGYNGSERFYQKKRFGFFPSAGLAWTISNESFWKSVKNTVNSFRLRGTYGVVGNDAIGTEFDRFFYLSEVRLDASRGSYFGNLYGERLDGVTVNRYSNTEIGWETAKKTNLAVELGLFNKVQIQADFFHELRQNILMSRAHIPRTMGLSAPISANVGEATGRGTDISVEYQHSFSPIMWLQVRGNFTYATNKIKVSEEPHYEKEWWKSVIGYPATQPRGYIAERLFVDDEEVANSPKQDFGSRVIAGDIKYKDVNKDGKIDEMDMVPIGYPTIPEIVYGFGFSYGYKGFDISAFLQGSARGSFWIQPDKVAPFYNGQQVLKAFEESHYSINNQELYALYPRLNTGYDDNNMQLSTWWLRNSAFLRLKQAEIGWSLPYKTAESLHLQSVRFYVSGTNLLSFSHFKLWDVEMGGNGLGYPLQRTFTAGINLTF